MKKLNIVLMAFALVAMMAQCKKDNGNATPDNSENTFAITLNVGSNGNSKADVNPMTGTVDFENGDKIYVGSGGKYVGSLINDGNHRFVGNITDPVEGEPLYFYFLGNMSPDETIAAGATEEFSVVISDQTEHLPVISCAPSNEEFSYTTATYTAHLKNKCALAKFNVTTLSTAPVCITGFNNKVAVNFTDNTLTNSQEADGVITLPAGNGEKWAILLPQEAVEEGEEGSAYSGFYSGIRPAIPEILVNGYLSDGIAIVLNAPEGAVGGVFTINGSGGHVLFSQGNLQYIGSAGDGSDDNTGAFWQFAEHQWDYLGQSTDQNSSSITADRDLFGWGTSGYDHGATRYQPWSTSTTSSQYNVYGNSQYNLYDQSGQADWGYNAIINGGNQENNGWRTLTANEWNYVFNGRVDAASKYGHGVVNGVCGMILLPDEWTLPEGLSFTSGNSAWANVYNATQWVQMEANGAVFLPAAGYRNGTTLSYVSSEGYYWSSKVSSFTPSINAFRMIFYDSSLTPSHSGYTGSGTRYYGCSVRLVRNVQ